MIRRQHPPRTNWQAKVEQLGLVYHTVDGHTYWDESAHYEFTPNEIDVLENATNELQEMCIKAAQHIIDANRFSNLAIPVDVEPLIIKAWNAEPPSLYGRFDLAYDGIHPPKLLEYNADTPTSLLESAVVQWFWMQELFPEADQFNSIHEKLLAKYQDIEPHLEGAVLYFAHVEDNEDWMTIAYLRDAAEQAGIRTSGILMHEIGWDSDRRCFTDMQEEEIRSIFKLYPWEWLIREKFGRELIDSHDRMQWIEPVWKMLWSNKGILPILWELYPGHPNLLEARFGDPGTMTEYVRKPLLSREGANIKVVGRYGVVKEDTQGDYGDEGYIYQALAPLRRFDSNYPVIGSWVIDGSACGIGIRESPTMVTDNRSRFIPYIFRP